MLDPIFGWQEISPASLRKLRQEIQGDDEGVVDEIGMLAIHSGYADRFFPGTSTLHQRPRYLFFTAWNFLWLKQHKVSGSELRRRKDKAELWVTEALRRGGEKRSIIGGKIVPRPPAQPVDFIYWTALRQFGLYRGPAESSRSTLYASWEETSVERVADVDRDREVCDSAKIALFDVPQVPRRWLKRNERLRFRLEPQEAGLLRDRICGLDTRCLLGEAVRLLPRRRWQPGNSPWNDALIKAAARGFRGEEAAIDRARRASILAEIARATYAALVEKVHEETTGYEGHDYRAGLSRYWTAGRSELNSALGLKLDLLAGDLSKLPKDGLALLKHLQERLRRVHRAGQMGKLLLDRGTYEVFKKVEERRKGSRARLPRTAAGRRRRAGFGPETITVEPLHYRWRQVRWLLEDLDKGLRRR